MRVGIIGDKNRAAVWEKYLRSLLAVKEVVITSSLSEAENIQACIILDDTAGNLHLLSDSIRLGIHSYLISELPVDEEQLKRICSLSQESDVRVQFSHWPTISPASQWMKNQLPKPDFIQIIKEQSHLNFTENRRQLSRSWTDEIGWIMKWMDMGTHRIEAQEVVPGNRDWGIRIFIKFENGSTASLFILTAGTEKNHRRIASGSNLLLDCRVEHQTVKKTLISGSQGISAESQTFDRSRSAGISVLLFFKAIKLKKDTAFTPFDALKTAATVKNINGLLKQL
ncbi:MAG: hypothetical protein WEC12_00380 [Balneolaceae bacterium]